MATPNYFTCTLGQASSHNLTDPSFQDINHLIAERAESIPAQPAVAFPIPPSKTGPDRPWGHTVYTFKDIHRASLTSAALLLKRHGPKLDQSDTVALICPSTPEFLLTWLGLMRLGFAVLLIAPQCQPSAIAHLCRETGVNVLYYEASYTSQATQAAGGSNDGLEALAMPFKSEFDILQMMKLGTGKDLPFPELQSTDVAYLHHTSGTSSGVPKPIPQTHRAGTGVLPCFAHGRERATFTTTPLYHGGIADLFRAWTSGAMIWLFPGKGVPITAANIVKCLDVAAERRRADGLPPVRYFSSVPYVLQSMEADDSGLRYLQMMDIVGVGGAALPAEVGDRLVEKGVNLISRFGSAECGFVMSSHRDYENDKEWQYLRSDQTSGLLRFEDQNTGDGLSELVINKEWPHMAKHNREDDAFATADLFAPHESIPNAWRYHSRADSQLTLLTGKKFDPAPLEGAIAASDLVDDVLIFGNGQPFPGALLFKSEAAQQKANTEIQDQLWPLIEKLNLESQDHARIPRKMLLAMSHLTTPLEKSSKGTIMRGAAESRFSKEIDNAYLSLGSSGSDIVPDDQVASKLIEMIQAVTSDKGALDKNTDLFAYGVDSVAGTQIRFGVRQLLPPQAGKTVPLNIVDDCGTVGRLAEYIVKTRHGQAVQGDDGDDDERELMLQLVDRYSRFAPQLEVDEQPSATNGSSSRDFTRDKDVVVLTGATGALGAHLLHLYQSSNDVVRVYCLVRGADLHAAKERVNKSLEQRGLAPIDDKKVVVLRSSMSDARLGLTDTEYSRVASEATVIMHAAWSVNFRMRLRSFEKDNIAGLTNLVNLALSTTRPEITRFGFCSSVASVMSCSSNPVPEAIVSEPSAATALGYSRSKWVAEQICHMANNQTPLAGRVGVFRVGQLSGDSHRGVWNSKEAWPMMLSSVKVTSCLPDLKGETLDWLPVDVAAAALVQGMQALTGVHDKSAKGGALTDVMHIVNDKANPEWSQLLQWMQKEREFAIVDPAEWISKLEEVQENNKLDHPAFRLLELWKRAYGHDARSASATDLGKQGKKSFAMEKTKQKIAALRTIEPVNEQYFSKIWRWIDESV